MSSLYSTFVWSFSYFISRWIGDNRLCYSFNFLRLIVHGIRSASVLMIWSADLRPQPLFPGYAASVPGIRSPCSRDTQPLFFLEDSPLFLTDTGCSWKIQWCFRKFCTVHELVLENTANICAIYIILLLEDIALFYNYTAFVRKRYTPCNVKILYTPCNVKIHPV